MRGVITPMSRCSAIFEALYRLISDEASTLTHAEACTVRSKHSDPASILLVEADSAAERALTIYEGWHDSVDAALSRRRDEV